ncbi:ferredoxin [Streptomyces sp. NPDC020742]|uniref:ferredoxin n=1 Tax=unclassified Streptomyces TaxID=2593676 RepID=UPI0033F1C97A
MRIAIDRDKCVGAGQCVLAADAVFEQDEWDGRVTLRVVNPSEDLTEAVTEAEHLCPSRAISVDRTAG